MEEQPAPGGGASLLAYAIEGEGADALLAESGGHRWQRVPPTERRGRVQTSTVTVVAVAARGPEGGAFDPRDVEMRATKDSGNGGQHRNKTLSAIVAIHRPTGIEAKAASRKQGRNRIDALATLAARVEAGAAAERRTRVDAERRALAGSGMRGDKVRTYRVRDGTAVDHRSGARARLADVVAGRALIGRA